MLATCMLNPQLFACYMQVCKVLVVADALNMDALLSNLARMPNRGLCVVVLLPTTVLSTVSNSCQAHHT